MRQEPLTPSTALLRHILDDSKRTWRMVLLIVAGTLCLATVTVAIAFAGLAGAVLVGGGSVAGALRLLSRGKGS